MIIRGSIPATRDMTTRATTVRPIAQDAGRRARSPLLAGDARRNSFGFRQSRSSTRVPTFGTVGEREVPDLDVRIEQISCGVAARTITLSSEFRFLWKEILRPKAFCEGALHCHSSDVTGLPRRWGRGLRRVR